MSFVKIQLFYKQFGLLVKRYPFVKKKEKIEIEIKIENISCFVISLSLFPFLLCRKCTILQKKKKNFR